MLVYQKTMFDNYYCINDFVTSKLPFYTGFTVYDMTLEEVLPRVDCGTIITILMQMHMKLNILPVNKAM